ncbi:type 2 DNA topoisomerase 6 subunit B-like isoform X2 [Alnus glutinosa]|uniref:type 2 DNA topoisomerase 6 subunit B-like isoform X2 n=1 Tax=Alnus glutinosa TaxID=3517 RepID=UPI002D782255|nr:type 2 DNA topoisomerase 6 subunit B-like isoform X2 [Alnus glutinosa]
MNAGARESELLSVRFPRVFFNGVCFGSCNLSACEFLQTFISSAIQRCRLSGELCRLSVILKCSPSSDPLVLLISISDTGVGSCLEEFRDLKFSREGIGAEKWVGVLSVRTTSICDNEVYHYQLDLKESASARRLTRLPSNPKNGVKFSGTEVFFSIFESVEVLLPEINAFFQKMLVLKIPNVAYEVVVEREDASGSRCEIFFLAKEPYPPPFSASNLERLKSGLEDYVLKHGNNSNEKCGSCFPSLEHHLKVGSGISCCTEGHRNAGRTMEAIIVISEISEPTSFCFRTCGAKSEVFNFKDFLPSSISPSSMKALTSIDWRSYGLTLASIVNQGGRALLEWEGLPPYAHIDIVLHCYHEQVMIPSVGQRTQLDRNLIKRAVKLALDDLKEKHAGVLLSAHALKIRSYAPDLAKTMTGLILSSNDSGFQEECFSLLGLQFQGVGGEIVEDCIKEKVVSVIEMNDRKSHQRSEEVAPFPFRDDCLEELEFQEEEYEEGEDAFSPLDI